MAAVMCGDAPEARTKDAVLWGRCIVDERPAARISLAGCCAADLLLLLLHFSFNRPRFKDKDMQQFKVLQRPLRV
ncbi:hypothetical protein LCM4579_13160 [Ensifer sp. LCM 4579]|nr:hypothetical protein LCM4579_13160 [Ensifer sp. LCM 4579]